MTICTTIVITVFCLCTAVFTSNAQINYEQNLLYLCETPYMPLIYIHVFLDYVWAD